MRKNARQGKLIVRRRFPLIVGGSDRSVRLVLLARIDRVIHLDAKADGNQIALVRLPVVPKAEQRDLVLARVEDAQGIPFELLAVFERAHEPVAVIGFESQPLLFCRIRWREACGQICVATVAGKGEERCKCGRRSYVAARLSE